MFEKNMRLSYLLDFYGEALDSRTRSILGYYYEDDLSLAEIAEGEGISRQGVRHIIKKGEEELVFLEDKLGLATHQDRLAGSAKRLSEVKEVLISKNDSSLKESIAVLDEVISLILNRGI